MKKDIIIAVVGIVILVGGYLLLSAIPFQKNTEDLDPTPRNVTLSGTFTCLPHADTTGPQTMECAFGLLTDDGVYYAVNFGA